MNRAAVAVGFVVLLVLWPVAAAGTVSGRADAGRAGSSAVGAVASSDGPGAISEPDGTESSADRQANDSDEAGWWPAHLDGTEPTLVAAETSADGEPAVDEQTTVTVRLRAITDAANVTVSLPDYRFVEGDDREWALGNLDEGETRTLTVEVTPTEAVARNLRFLARGETADGAVRQRFSHDLAAVERGLSAPSVQVSPTAPAGPIPDTTVDPLGNRTAGGASTAGTSSASNGYVTGAFFVGVPSGGVEPVRGARVEVWEDDPGLNPDNHIATGKTDAQGRFNVTVNDPASTDNDNVADVYVKVFAENRVVKVTKGGQYRVRHPSGSNTLRNGQTVHLGTFVPASAQPAFQATTWAYEVFQFVKSETGFTRRKIEVKWPKTDWPSYHPAYGSAGNVRPNLERITLPDRNDQAGQDWDRSTVHHEYGHALMMAMYEYSRGQKPSKGSYAGHTLYSETDPGFAMIEGWAAFVEAAVARDGSVSNAESGDWFDTPPQNPTDSDGNSLPDGDLGDMDGNRVEGAYANLFWDITDGGAGDDDDINGSQPGVGFEQVFDTVSDHNVQSLTDFLARWDDGHDEALARAAFESGVLIADPYQPNNRFATAAPIGIEKINATIGSGVDYYRLTVPRWTDPDVSLGKVKRVRSGDLDLVVYDAGRNRVAASETSSSNEHVTLPATGESLATYYVEVSTDSGVPATYQLAVDGSLVDDSEEDNDRLRDAARIAGDGTTERYRLTTDAVDYYETWVEDQGTLNVSLDRGNDRKPRWVDAADLLEIELYHENGTFLDTTAYQHGTPTINYTTGDADFYVIAVTARERDTPLSYDLNVSAAPPDNDRFEPNDDEDRTSVQYPVPANAILVDGEDDWYGRWVTNGSELNVTIPEVPGEQVWFEIGDPSGHEVAQGSDGDSLVIQNTAAGEYKIRVWTRHANTAEYRLYVEDDPTPGVDPGPDRFEANDAFSTATNVGRSLANASLSIHDDDDDYYRLSLNAGDRLNVSLSYNSSHMTGSPSLQLYGPGQVPLQNAGIGNDRSVTIQQDGVYYVEVSGNGAYPYSLAIEGNDEYEDNDDRTSASTWPWYYSGLSAVIDNRFNATLVAGEDDWYSLYLREGQRLSTTVQPTEYLFTAGLPAGYLNVSVYDDQGTRLAQSEPNGEAVARAPANGTYFVRVHPWENRSYTTDYELAMRDSPGPDGGDDRANATLYVPGDDDRTFALADGSDEAYYAVYLERGQGLEVDLGFEGTSDIDVELYGPDGNSLTQTNTEPFNDVALSADTIAVADGYHYVRVHGATTATPYNLSIEEIGDDGFERNDDRYSATPLQFRTVEGRLFEGVGDSFGGGGTQRDETDVFAVNVTEPTTLNATLTFEQYGLSNSTIEDGSDLDLALLNDRGIVVAADSSIGDEASVRAALSVTGTYYLRVNATGLDTVTPYELSVDRDGFDPVVGSVRNPEQYLNTPVTEPAGSLLGEGGTTALRLERGDNVSHAVQLRAGERLHLSTSGDGELDLALYDATGTLLRKSASVGASESISFEAVENGPVYVETRAAGETRVDATLAAATDTPTNDRREPNDEIPSATPITVGEYDGLHAAPDDPDYHAIDLRTGQRLSVEATFDAVEGPLELAVLGPEGSELSVDTDREAASAYLTAETDGTYYVRVRGVDFGIGAYGLSIGVTTPNNDAFEGNDVIESAQPLEPGSYEGLRIATGDRDVFAVELAAGERLTADVAFEQAQGDLDLYLHGPEGEVRALSSSETDDETASLRAEWAGTYYIEVRGVGGSSADYRLTLATESLPANDRFEPNDGLEAVRTLQADTYDDLRILPGDHDLFAVAAPPGENLTASVAFSHAAGNLDLEVFGPDRLTVGTSTSYTDGESVTVPTGDGGTYYVHVSGVGDAVAAYDLTVSTTGTEPTDEPDVDPIGGGDPPTNLDDDPLLEDVDGNGDGNLFDALAYYNNRDSETIVSNPDRFDFDGNGESGSLFDALALYNELAS